MKASWRVAGAWHNEERLESRNRLKEAIGESAASAVAETSANWEMPGLWDDHLGQHETWSAA